MLALEIEFLTGNIVSANAAKTAVDWPPQPDRIFSALVASWAARGERAEERAALEWLEGQNPPRILAGGCAPRTVATVYVPPNDFITSSTGFDVLPSRRQRQARSFPSAALNDRSVKLVWPERPGHTLAQTLDALARDTAYIGHSSSLTRCRFIEGEFNLSESRPPSRMIYKGRLAELEQAFRRGERPSPGEVVVTTPPYHALAPRSVFSSNWETQWAVLGDDGGSVPDLRAAPFVARKLRDALMGAYQRARSCPPPAWLCGHTEDGAPLAEPHAAFVPLADVGWQYAEGRLLGFAVILPRGVAGEELYPAIAQLTAQGDANGRIELNYGGKAPWYLHASPDQRASLAPARWVRQSRTWATVTPIVLDKYPKKKTPEERTDEIHALIASACENIGLPTPAFVRCSRISAVRGGPPVPAGPDVPLWQQWRMPETLSRRYATHAIIGFDRPVDGPIILGAGRFVGLGFCLPFSAEHGHER